jgi:hypothetical protein
MTNYSNLIGSTALSNQFTNSFADSATKLLDSHPVISLSSFPTTINEGLASVFSVHALHFDTSYVTAYEWHLDGSEASISSSWNYTPSANASGNHSVQLFVGQATGSSRVDRTKPFYTVTKTVQVLNTLPAQGLNFTLPQVATSSVNVTLTVATGAALSNCSSFSTFLVSQGTTPPSSSDPNFNRTCATGPTQSESFTLSGVDGLKTISLWTKDADGIVSSTPVTQTITLDRVLPSVSHSGLQAKYAGGKTLAFNYSASDLESGLASLELHFSFAGSAFAKVKDLSFTGTGDSMTLPLADVNDARLRIVATDIAGNIAITTSSNFTIDSTAPSAPSITRTSAAITNSLTVSLAATCTGITDILVGESVTATDTTGWTSCAATLSHTLSGSTEGTRTIKIYSRDDVGNVSGVTNVSLTYDASIPTATLSSTPAALSSEATFNFQFSGTDNLTAVGSLTFACSLNAGSFSACTSPHTASGFVTGPNTFRVRSTDLAGNVSTVASYTWDFDNSAPTLSFTSVTSLSPSPSNSLSARSVTVGGTNISSYKYTVIHSGACSAVDYSGLFEITLAGNTTITFTPTIDQDYRVCAIGKSSFGVWQLAANASSSPVLKIDTAAPTLNTPVLTPASFGTTTSPTVAGTAENSATVTLHMDSVTCALAPQSTTTAHASTGAYSLAATALTTDSSHNYYVKATDSAGNSTCSAALPYTLDRINPVVALTALTGGEVVKGSQATTITWTATDVNLTSTPITLEYSLNAGANWTQIASGLPNSGTYSWIMPGFNSTTAKVRVTAIDKAGNVAQDATASTFTIDSTSPIVTLTTLTGGQIVKAGATQLINWTASDSNTTGNWITLSYSTDAGTNWTAITSTTNTGSYTWTVPAATNSSTFRVKVTATDRVGQITEASSTSNFIIDAINPTVTLTSFTGGQAVLGNSYQTITWTASDANFAGTPITIELSSNGGSTWSVLASNLANSGSYSWFTNVSDGNTYRVRVTATDAATLSSASSSAANFTVSTQAPNLSQTAKTSPYYSNADSTVTFGGTCDNGYVINISGAQTSSTTCSSGTWSWTTASESTDGTRTYNFSQTNAVLTLTISAIWVRDTSAPAALEVTLNNGDAQTPAPTVSAAITTGEVGISVRLANAVSSSSSCQALYANNNWRTQTALTTTFSHILSSGDGLKKVCVWVKDQAGNVSVLSPAVGTLGVDMDTIAFASGNPPQVVAFDVVNDGGGPFQGLASAYIHDPLKITWNISDVEGLSNNPVMLDYTLDGVNWVAIESAYGGLSGPQTSYASTYVGFSAPSSSFFRVRIRAKDAAGNISSELMSKAFNTTPWSVVAGSPGRGVGGSAKSALITRPNTQFSNFAMNPINGDVYFVDQYFGLKKMSAATGIISIFIEYGTYNLGSAGTLGPGKSLNTSSMKLLFDQKGFLYIFTDNNHISYNENSERVLRVNLSTLEYTTYLGKGTQNTTGSAPTDVFVLQSAGIAFDESNTLYFTSSCTPGVRFTPGGPSNAVLMKVTQNADGTPGAVTRIAGNCTRGVPTSGVLAINNPLSAATYAPWDIGIAAWGNGRYVYYTDGEGNGYKIIDGITYKSSLNTGAGVMIYDPVSGLIKSANSQVWYTTPNLLGDNGDIGTSIVPGNGTGATCGDEGTPAAQACGLYWGGTLSSSGKFFFIDGGEGALTRLRYLDDSNNLQTLIGAKSFSGEGQNPSNAKGGFAGIHYKKSTDPLSLVFPEGLYFMERFGGVFGYFTDTTTVKVLGNQTGAGTTFGTPLTSNQSLGPLVSQAIGALSAFFFDRNGNVLLRVQDGILAKLDGSMVLTQLNTNPAEGYWVSTLTEASDPRNYSMWPYVGGTNMAMKDDGKVFIMGNYYDPSSSHPDAHLLSGNIKIFDYETNSTKFVMGHTPTQGYTPQQTGLGSLKNASLDNCINNHCAQFYDQTTDRYYFAEGGRLRYITNPENPSQHTLINFMTATVGTIENFSFSPNRKYLMYTSSGRLYCHAVSSADNSAICNNNPSLHTNLGPPPGLTSIYRGRNQFT